MVQSPLQEQLKIHDFRRIVRKIYWVCVIRIRSLPFAAMKITRPFLPIKELYNTMDPKVIMTVFAAVFIAELGDKTQLATMLFAADKSVSKWAVFLGASLALIAASALGVMAGTVLSNYISEKTLSMVAGIGFIVIGVWTLVRV